MSLHGEERRGNNVTDQRVTVDRKAAARVRVSGVAGVALSVITAVVLSACASSPDSHYYTLTEGDGSGSGIGNGNGSDAANGLARQPLLIEVMPVNVPSQVSRPQIVTSTPDGQINIHDYSRWSSPLDDEIGNALSQGLSHRLGAIDTYRTPRAPGSTAYQITVNVQKFVSIPGETASIDAVWSIVRSSDQLTLTCHSSASEPIDQGFESLAAGQRKALSRVVDQIALGVETERPVPVQVATDTSVPAAAAAPASGAKGKIGHTPPPPPPTLKPVPPVLSCPG